jgi:hypothetical protein
MSKPTAFSNVLEALSVVNYIEQLISAENQWINNRVSWLFISQSFCISAYTILATSSTERFSGGMTLLVLEFGLPVLGILSSVLVGAAVIAATRVSGRLARERCRIVRYINENSPATIPLAGVEVEARAAGRINRVGSLPHWILPWVLGVLWTLLLVSDLRSV